MARFSTHKGERIEGLFAAGEVSGFGGGGYHGYNALEGQFPGRLHLLGAAGGPGRSNRLIGGGKDARPNERKLRDPNPLTGLMCSMNGPRPSCSISTER